VLDTAHELLTATRLEVEGRFIARLRRSYLSPRAERDDDVRPPCFYMHAEYRAMTNAAEPPGS
jgi:hypothetical protein